MEHKPVIYKYDDYRKFLKDFYDYSKAVNDKFSYRYFSRKAGISSPSFLKHVIDGEKNLSLNGVKKFAKALNLNKEESIFFENLVLFNQAKDVKKKLTFAKAIARSRKYKKLYPLKLAQMKYLTKWYFIAIRELVSLPEFEEDAEWIAKKLRPNITPAEARKALEELLNMRLLIRDDKGNLKQAQENIMALDAFATNAMIIGHREMLKKASESIERFPRDERELSAHTLKLNPQMLKKIKEMINNFRNDLMEETSRNEDPSAVYQFNLYLFPLTDPKKKGKVDE